MIIQQQFKITRLISCKIGENIDCKLQYVYYFKNQETIYFIGDVRVSINS